MIVANFCQSCKRVTYSPATPNCLICNSSAVQAHKAQLAPERNVN